MNSEKMKELKFDFNQTTTKIIEKIERKSYKKLAFLAISTSIFITLGVNFIPPLLPKHTSSLNEVSYQNSISQIKSMKVEEFNNFLNYLKNNSNIYNDSSSVVIDNLFELETKVLSSSVTNKGKKQITEGITSYKKQIEQIINNANIIYEVKQLETDEQIKQIKKEDLINVSTYFNNYRASVYTRNLEVESLLHTWLYDIEGSRKEIYEKMKGLDKVIDQGFQKTIITPKSSSSNKL